MSIWDRANFTKHSSTCSVFFKLTWRVVIGEYIKILWREERNVLRKKTLYNRGFQNGQFAVTKFKARLPPSIILFFSSKPSHLSPSSVSLCISLSVPEFFHDTRSLCRPSPLSSIQHNIKWKRKKKQALIVFPSLTMSPIQLLCEGW